MYFGQLLLQVALIFGSIVLLGLLVHWCEKLFYYIMPSSRSVYLTTGLVGTPVHELSHALMCIIFGHKIVAINLYTPNSQDGSLGSVEHMYNPKNIYQSIGNFFIGIAPITVGSLVLVMLQSVSSNQYVEILGVLWAEQSITWDAVSQYVSGSFGSIFAVGNLSSWVWWLCLVVSMQIALHMGLSGADVAGSWAGGIMLVILYIVVAMVISIFIDITLITAFAGKIASIVLAVGSLALLMIALWLILALVICGIRRLRRR